jgi:uncharacterized RDD family membrane protein YckC/Tfp pilus assembly major pilin PilA
VPGTAVYANFGRRLVAFLLDLGILFLLSLTVTASMGHALPGQPDYTPLATLGCFWLYKAILESSPWQASVGKRVMGIKVTDRVGRRIGFGRATGRFFAQFLSYLFLCFGYLMAAFTQRRQALHDYIAGTLVTRHSATPQEIADSPTVAGGDGLVITVVVLVGGVAIIGILAAIAIPAYQNYTIRAQVADTLNHADAYKAAVSQAFASGADSSTITTAPGGLIGLDARNSSRYADSIEVSDGTILITYGGQANPKLTGKHLALYPILGANSDVTWVCGLAAPPAALDGDRVGVEASQRLTDVAPQYLPTSCHQ